MLLYAPDFVERSDVDAVGSVALCHVEGGKDILSPQRLAACRIKLSA
jgi:hypothetical protein